MPCWFTIYFLVPMNQSESISRLTYMKFWNVNIKIPMIWRYHPKKHKKIKLILWKTHLKFVMYVLTSNLLILCFRRKDYSLDLNKKPPRSIYYITLNLFFEERKEWKNYRFERRNYTVSWDCNRRIYGSIFGSSYIKFGIKKN